MISISNPDVYNAELFANLAVQVKLWLDIPAGTVKSIGQWEKVRQMWDWMTKSEQFEGIGKEDFMAVTEPPKRNTGNEKATQQQIEVELWFTAHLVKRISQSLGESLGESSAESSAALSFSSERTTEQ